MVAAAAAAATVGLFACQWRNKSRKTSVLHLDDGLFRNFVPSVPHKMFGFKYSIIAFCLISFEIKSRITAIKTSSAYSSRGTHLKTSQTFYWLHLYW